MSLSNVIVLVQALISQFFMDDSQTTSVIELQGEKAQCIADVINVVCRNPLSFSL